MNDDLFVLHPYILLLIFYSASYIVAILGNIMLSPIQQLFLFLPKDAYLSLEKQIPFYGF
jgi:hypothetical protein